MSRVAVIGSGISGLAAGWLLSARHTVSLFEKEPRLGGHTDTHSVATPDGPVPIDTGFIVHNEVNYPLLCRLLRELNIPTAESDMSFGVSSRPERLTWCSRGLNGLFAQRGNLLRPEFYALLREINRFNSTAALLLDEKEADAWTLGTWLGRERFSSDFCEHYLIPMAAAVWSTAPREVMKFPAATLVRFFQNHGFLGFRTQHRWRTIPGGCSRYIDPCVQRFRDRVYSGRLVKRVERTSAEVTVRAEGLPPMTFDEVVFACHGDEVLPALADPTQGEREVFAAFTTNRNEVALHTDASILPAKRRAWASWNHLRVAGAESRLVVTYHMNRLQKLATKTDYFVSLNAEGLIREDRVVKRMTYRHPQFTLDAIRAQGRWQDVSGRNRTHYCGAYWGNGFHEDGVRSAVRVAQRMGIEW
ncbi:MAG: FAD-dependent oxidoreductase [Planctomycetes bacterium]|nr:FAD-dependent oxidoreductase [Planctomycetota bacterium]